MAASRGRLRFCFRECGWRFWSTPLGRLGLVTSTANVNFVAPLVALGSLDSDGAWWLGLHHNCFFVGSVSILAGLLSEGQALPPCVDCGSSASVGSEAAGWSSWTVLRPAFVGHGLRGMWGLGIWASCSWGVQRGSNHAEGEWFGSWVRQCRGLGPFWAGSWWSVLLSQLLYFLVDDGGCSWCGWSCSSLQTSRNPQS